MKYCILLSLLCGGQKVNDELKRREAENADLKRDLGELRRLMNSLKQQLNGGAR